MTEPDRIYTQESVDKLVALQRRALRRIADLETRQAEMEEDIADLQERVGTLRRADRYVTKDEVKSIVNSAVSGKVSNMIQKAARSK